MRGEALSEADDALTEILPTPQLLQCTSLNESPQMQLIGLAGPILACVCLASIAATPYGSTDGVLLHHHTQLMIWMTTRSHQDPAPKTPTVVSSTGEAALKPSSQVSLGTTPKGHLNWKINGNFPEQVPVPALVKCVRILLWIFCEAEVYR